jgi:hypothetical protein
MSDIVTFIVFVWLTNKSHNVTSCSNAVLELRKPWVSNTFEDGSKHSRLREILIEVLTQNKVPVFNTDESNPGTFVNIVSLHRAHIWRNVEALHIVKNRFPLSSDVSVTADLTNMIHVYIEYCSSLQHNCFELLWFCGILGHCFIFKLKVPCVFVSSVINICNFIFQIQFFLNFLSSLPPLIVNAFVQKLIT